MKITYVLAGAIVALFVVPGTASQLTARMSTPPMSTPSIRGTAGLFHDPNIAPQLSITLPTRFTALDVGTHPLDSFRR